MYFNSECQGTKDSIQHFKKTSNKNSYKYQSENCQDQTEWNHNYTDYTG